MFTTMQALQTVMCSQISCNKTQHLFIAVYFAFQSRLSEPQHTRSSSHAYHTHAHTCFIIKRLDLHNYVPLKTSLSRFKEIAQDETST